MPDKAALRARGRKGEDIQWTWTQYHDEVRAVGKGLIELGLEQFHTVAILGHNDPAWHISNLAAIHAGGFSTGIYQTNTAAACQYIADDSRANVVVVGDLVQLEKVLSIRDSLPHLRSIVLYGEDEVPSDTKVNNYSFQFSSFDFSKSTCPMDPTVNFEKLHNLICIDQIYILFIKRELSLGKSCLIWEGLLQTEILTTGWQRLPSTRFSLCNFVLGIF